MFTGIVTELGTVVDLIETAGGRQIVIEALRTTKDLAVGDSIAVNGVCLTAIDVPGHTFTAEAVGETLSRSNLGELEQGDGVNLERPTPANGRFDGHVVQGHVDGVAVVETVEAEGESTRMRLGLPPGLARYVAEKGSVTLDGVSLTITAVGPPGDGAWCEVVLIPHTLDVTILGRRRPGDRLNVEVDVIAKYVERMLEART